MPITLTVPLRPYPCARCGTLVRKVTATTGEAIVINEEPDPNGNIIPWPSPAANGLAQARRITVPVHDTDTWSEHTCR